MQAWADYLEGIKSGAKNHTDTGYGVKKVATQKKIT